MAHSPIKGPEDYKLFYHTDGVGNIWINGKRNPISRDNPLTGTQVDSISPLDLCIEGTQDLRFTPQKPQLREEESSTALLSVITYYSLTYPSAPSTNHTTVHKL